MKFLRKYYIAKSPLLVILICVVLLFLTVIASLCFGAVSITPTELYLALQGRGTEATARIFTYVRLPRTIATVLAGAALSTSGLVIQSVLDNPLAGPGIIGVNSGAGFTVVLCCAIFPVFPKLIPVASFFGAMAAMLIVYGIGRATRASRITIILAGVAVSNILNAGIDTVVTLIPDALTASNAFKIGGVAGITMQKMFSQAWLILAVLAAVFALAGDMDILVLGEETAKSLGMNVSRYRFIFLLLAALLTGFAVSFCGLLGFVGLLVPHTARRLVGYKNSYLILFCIIGGAAFLTFCDLLARTIFSPFELPVGIVLSVLGGPFFLWLLLHQKRRSGHD